MVTCRNNQIVDLYTRIRRRAVRRHFINYDTLQLIYATALRMQWCDLTSADTNVAADHATIADQLIHNFGC